LYAQDTSGTIGHVSISAPTAASLGKYGDMPVSYNTGTPQVSIPLYTVKSGSLTLPIGLSYHASGLKVQEKASWVGAGWSLNAGGAITRTVVGGPDDRGVTGYSNYVGGHYSDYGYASYQWVSGSGFGAINGMVSDDAGFEQGRKDGEPDLYFFNFAGHTGKFYFNDDRTPMIVPEQDLRISPDLNNGTGGLGFQGFIVTTPDGVKYYFGKTGKNTGDDPVEISIPSTLQNGPAYANQAVSSWFLNKIVSADGMDSIILSYMAEKYSYYMLSMSPITNVQTGYFLDASTINGYNVIKNFVQGVRLSQITYPNGTVTLNKAAAARTDLSDWAGQAFVDGSNIESYALGSIQVSDNNGFCKKDSFYYGYFYDANATTLNSSTYGTFNLHSDAYRLRLDSVQESACSGGLNVPPYKFSYFPELVPRNLSFGFDHWGFSNGITSNNGVIPTYTLLYNSDITYYYGANREPSWPAMRGGALQQITYPTGGFTRMEFEAHDTYMQYPVYTKVTKLSGAAIGHSQDPSHPPTGSFTTDPNANVMEVSLSADANGPDGQLQIWDPSNTQVASVSIAPGASSNSFFTFSPSTTYTWKFSNTGGNNGGGASASVYEELATPTQGNVTVGGLRIKNIINYNAVTPDTTVTSYTYNYGGTASSGVLYSRPVYVEPIRNDIYGLVYIAEGVNGCAMPAFINPQGTSGTYYITGGSVTPLSTVQGNHIGYNQVQVTQAGNGYSIYRYYGSNLYDTLQSDVCTRVVNISYCSPSIPNFPIPPLPYECNRGELKYEGHFNQAGQALKDATYTYTYVNNPIQTPGIMFITVPGLYSYTSYLLQTARKIKTQVASTQWDPVDQAALADTTTTYYGSTYHHEATRKVKTTSTGDSLVTNIKFVFDFRGNNCDASITDSLPFYNSTVHTDSATMYTNIATCGINQMNWPCRYDTLQDFRYFMAMARQKYIGFRCRNYTNQSNVLGNCQVSALNAADTLLKPVLRLQSLFVNAPIENSDWKNTNLRQASFTKYDTSLTPLGFAYPRRMQMIHLQAPSSTFAAAAVSGTSISKDSRYLDESVFSFGKGNPLQVTPHDGVSLSYVWDYLNTEPIAKVVNATVDQVAYTSFEADGNGSWTIPSGLRDAYSITGAKCYNLSNGTCSRSNLTSSATYIVSYWSKTGSSFSISGSTAVKQGKTISGFTYFEHTVTGVTSVSVSGSGDIDELRLYPSTAQMTTYTYSPLIGMTSQCDVDNRVSYFSYDALGRLRVVKDQDGNILKTTEYHYAGQ
jgi:YD repeat-containing protein